jgi:hypothetical protein
MSFPKFFNPQQPGYRDEGGCFWGKGYWFPLAGLGVACAEATRFGLMDAEFLRAIDDFTHPPAIDFGINFPRATEVGADMFPLPQGDREWADLLHLGDDYVPSFAEEALFASEYRLRWVLPLHFSFTKCNQPWVQVAHLRVALNALRQNPDMLLYIPDYPAPEPEGALPAGFDYVPTGEPVTADDIEEFSLLMPGVEGCLVRALNDAAEALGRPLSGAEANEVASRIFGTPVDLTEGMLIPYEDIGEACELAGLDKFCVQFVPLIGDGPAARLNLPGLVGASWSVALNKVLNLDPNWPMPDLTKVDFLRH